MIFLCDLFLKFDLIFQLIELFLDFQIPWISKIRQNIQMFGLIVRLFDNFLSSLPILFEFFEPLLYDFLFFGLVKFLLFLVLFSKPLFLLRLSPSFGLFECLSPFPQLFL